VLLHGVILTAVVLIAWMARRHGHHHLAAGAAFGLILGGAVGNLIDRVLYGWVIDCPPWVSIGGGSWSCPTSMSPTPPSRSGRSCHPERVLQAATSLSMHRFIDPASTSSRATASWWPSAWSRGC
jgi:hypothetical protein